MTKIDLPLRELSMVAVWQARGRSTAFHCRTTNRDLIFGADALTLPDGGRVLAIVNQPLPGPNVILWG